MRDKKQSRRKSLLKCGRLKMSDLSSFWSSSIISFHPGVRVMPLTDIQRKILSKKQTAFLKSDIDSTFAEFLSWSIEEWKDVISVRFGWMKDPPRSPECRFFLSRFDEFFALFERRDRNWKEILASPEEDRPEESKSLQREKKEIEMERRKLEIERSKIRRVESRKSRADISEEDKSKELKQYDWNDEDDQ